jgi:hypothetical protein
MCRWFARRAGANRLEIAAPERYCSDRLGDPFRPPAQSRQLRAGNLDSVTPEAAGLSGCLP